jgi:hypothetical protein
MREDLGHLMDVDDDEDAMEMTSVCDEVVVQPPEAPLPPSPTALPMLSGPDSNSTTT